MSASNDMVIILTGASRGIGLAIARHLLTTSTSTKLVLTSRTTTSLTTLADEHGADRVEVVAGNASDPALAPKLVACALERWGRLDALIINHGALDPVKKVADSSPAEWRDAFDVNVFSAVGMVRYTLDSWDTSTHITDIHHPRSKLPSPLCAPRAAASSSRPRAQQPAHTRAGARTAPARPC